MALSSESEMGRVGCEIYCSNSGGTTSVVVIRKGRIIFQTISSSRGHTTNAASSYAVELCEGDVVALRTSAAAAAGGSKLAPSRATCRRVFSEHHDAEYMAEELMLMMEENEEKGGAACIVGVIGRHEDSVQPPESNY